MATIIASTVPVFVLAVAVIILSVVAIVWIGWKMKRKQDDLNEVHEFEICTKSGPIKGFKIHKVTERCDLKTFTVRMIGGSQVKNGFIYYQWEEAEEYIKSEREVMVYHEEIEPQEDSQVFLCQRDEYNKLRKFRRPDLTGTQWTAIFVQCKSENRELPQGTRILYCKSPTLHKIKKNKYKVIKVEEDSEIKMVKFGRKNIPNYNHTAGFGYHEFRSDQHISSDKKILMMDKNDDVFTGPGVYRIVDVDGPNIVHRPDLSETDWKCAFIQSDSADRKLEPGTWFLYCKM